MDKTDVEPGEVYLARAQDEQYDHRVSVVEVVEVPDDDHPDVIGETLYSNHRPGAVGAVTSVSTRMFETRLYDGDDAE